MFSQLNPFLGKTVVAARIHVAELPNLAGPSPLQFAQSTEKIVQAF